MKYYCPNCENECMTKIIVKDETLKVRGQEITIKIKVRICEQCKEEILDRELDNENLKLFYDEYKKINNLLTTTEIKNIREQWGLSQSQFAILLGMGEKTITRYENGSIQDETHDNLIRLAKEHCSFKTIWELRNHKLDEKSRNKVLKILNAKDTAKNYFFTSVSLKPSYEYKYEQLQSNNFQTRRLRNAKSKYSA